MAVILEKGRARRKKRTGRKMKPTRTIKRRSAAAAALASPRYRKRLVKSAKLYSRKGKSRTQQEENGEA